MATVNLNTYSKDEAFWVKYVRGRPRVPQSFFDRIFDYHVQHGGSFDSVHDAGAGVGVHSARFEKRFKTVHVSDISPENIEIAKSRFPQGDKFTFRAARLQDPAVLPPASIDLFFCAVAIHFCGKDVPAAVEAAAHQLKPGGTLAIAGFGVAVFDDPKLQPLWSRLTQRGVEATIGAVSPEIRDAMFAVIQVAGSSYDAIPLPEEFFEPGAQRIKSNFPKGWNWRDTHVAPSFSASVPPLDRRGKHDVEVFEENLEWTFSMTPEELEAHLASYPYKKDEQLDKYWAEVQEMTKQGNIRGRWPSVLLLATKK